LGDLSSELRVISHLDCPLIKTDIAHVGLRKVRMHIGGLSYHILLELKKHNVFTLYLILCQMKKREDVFAPCNILQKKLPNPSSFYSLRNLNFSPIFEARSKIFLLARLFIYFVTVLSKLESDEDPPLGFAFLCS